MLIRRERASDYDAIYELVKKAFASAEVSNGNEQNYVGEIRAQADIYMCRSLP